MLSCGQSHSSTAIGGPFGIEEKSAEGKYYGNGGKDVPKAEPSRDQAGLHRGSPGLPPKLQRTMRPREVVLPPQQLKRVIEVVHVSGMTKGLPVQVCLPLSNSQVHSLDERGVERGIVL